MSTADEVILLDYEYSHFSMRVNIALKEKGIPYESREQNLFNKGQYLLEMNPVHNKVPVLIHKGRPICESLILIQYIDEVWTQNSPLLPADPYERARARFWSDYIDRKIENPWKMLFTGKGEAVTAAMKELMDYFTVLEAELGDKSYFGGNKFGITDIALIPYYGWFHTMEKLGNCSLNDVCPKLVAWAKRCMEKESVSSTLPDQHVAYNFILSIREMFGIA